MFDSFFISFASFWDWHVAQSNFHLWFTMATFVVHQIAYYGFSTPFIIIDFIPALQKYKIQPKEVNTWSRQWACLKRLMIAQIGIQLPLMYFAYPTFQYLGCKEDSREFPSISQLLCQILFFMVIEDFWFYWNHRFMHWKVVYKYVHKVHHEHVAPFAIAAEDVHPVETLLLGLGVFLGPFLCCMVSTMHLTTLWVWMVVRLYDTVTTHCGYSFGGILSRLLPFWAGAEFHDYHHMTSKGNYASFFTVWDRICGTDQKWLQVKNQKHM